MNLLTRPVLFIYQYFPSKVDDFSFGLVKELGLDKDLKQGNWASFDQKIQQQSQGQLTKVIDGICISERYNKEVEKYINENSSEVQKLIAGVYYTYIAWEKRSKKVSNEQWGGFYEYLNKADSYLNQEFKHLELKLDTLARLIRVNMGLSQKELAYQNYLKTTNLNPNHVLTNYNFFKVLTPKWLGSNEEVFDFIISKKDDEIGAFVTLLYLIEVYSDLDNANEKISVAKEKFKQQTFDLYQNLLTQINIKYNTTPPFGFLNIFFV